MNTIRHKLFFQFGTMMLLFILLLFLANTFFLETLYINSAKSGITELYKEVNKIDSSNYTGENLYNILSDSGLFVDFVIIDNENEVLYMPHNPLSSVDQNKPVQRAEAEPHNNTFTTIEETPISENNKFIQGTDNKTNASFIMFNGLLDNGYEINIRINMASISQNVRFLNQFIIIVGIIIILISLIAANILSKYFAEPILNIFNVTDRIKNMDFSSTCEVTTNDEIGRLAENINEMSYALKDNIEGLATSNQQLTEEISERLKIDEQRKALLNNVSHELKTPLSLVQGYSEGLKLNLHKNVEKTNFYCDVIIDESKKMDILVSQLLDINHIQFGDFPLHKEETLALDFITYIVKKYKPLFKESQVNYSQNLTCLSESEQPVNIIIDALRSEQILTNLFNNAIAYADEDKNIQLSAVIIQAEPSSHRHLRITLSNSCHKVPDVDLEQWWNSFYKADKARTRENGGYGLGLSIIKAIQEADSNYYGVFSEEGLIHFTVDFDIVD